MTITEHEVETRVRNLGELIQWLMKSTFFIALIILKTFVIPALRLLAGFLPRFADRIDMELSDQARRLQNHPPGPKD
jgi:hypothetical protein